MYLKQDECNIYKTYWSLLFTLSHLYAAAEETQLCMLAIRFCQRHAGFIHRKDKCSYWIYDFNLFLYLFSLQDFYIYSFMSVIFSGLLLTLVFAFAIFLLTSAFNQINSHLSRMPSGWSMTMKLISFTYSMGKTFFGDN